MADLLHQYGAKGCIQLDSGLGRPQRYLIPALENVPMPTYAASAVPEFMYEDKLCVELTKEQILANLEDVRKAARFIGKESGYDAIEILAYGGYLADCFLTKRWNKRTDEYGGEDLRSRAKYLLDMIAAVREEVGPDFPVFVKFTPSHFMEEEGYRNLDEGIELAKLLEEAGADLLHVDAGCFENWELSLPPSYQQEETWSVVEMAETMLPGHDPMACKNMVKKIIDRDTNITVHTGTKLICIEDDGVIVEKDGQQCKMPCDTVVLAMGLVAAPSPFEEIKDQVSVRDLGMNPLVLQATAHAREAVQEIAGVTPDMYERRMDKLGFAKAE